MLLRLTWITRKQLSVSKADAVLFKQSASVSSPQKTPTGSCAVEDSPLPDDPTPTQTVTNIKMKKE